MRDQLEVRQHGEVEVVQNWPIHLKIIFQTLLLRYCPVHARLECHMVHHLNYAFLNYALKDGSVYT
jgi:hypothetical protein